MLLHRLWYGNSSGRHVAIHRQLLHHLSCMHADMHRRPDAISLQRHAAQEDCQLACLNLPALTHNKAIPSGGQKSLDYSLLIEALDF